MYTFDPSAPEAEAGGAFWGQDNKTEVSLSCLVSPIFKKEKKIS